MLARPLIILLVCSIALSAADYDEAFHPDGSLHYKIKLDREGQRNGSYVIYHPGGSEDKKGPKAEVGTYRGGKLHGVITKVSPEGEMLSEAQWVNGVCLLPMTDRYINFRLSLIKQAARESIASLPNDGRKRPSDQILIDVLVRLNHYRLLCGLDHDVEMDMEFVHQAQCAAEICSGINTLDHHPKRNPGLSEERWQAGQSGCARSNLAMGLLGVAAVDGWMDDSDDMNRDKLSHRRAKLSPSLKRIGYGQEGRYAACYVRGSGTPSRNPPAVMFPPQGLMPISMFATRACWSLQPDPDLYAVTKDAALTIHPMDAKSGELGPAIELQFDNLIDKGSKRRSLILAQPKALPLRKQALFKVVVTGVSKKDPSAPDLDWITMFY